MCVPHILVYVVAVWRKEVREGRTGVREGGRREGERREGGKEKKRERGKGRWKEREERNPLLFYAEALIKVYYYNSI